MCVAVCTRATVCERVCDFVTVCVERGNSEDGSAHVAQADRVHLHAIHVEDGGRGGRVGWLVGKVWWTHCGLVRLARLAAWQLPGNKHSTPAPTYALHTRMPLTPAGASSHTDS